MLNLSRQEHAKALNVTQYCLFFFIYVQSYHRMALQLHPDKQQQQKMSPLSSSTDVSITDLNAAKSVLLDPELRLNKTRILFQYYQLSIGKNGIRLSSV